MQKEYIESKIKDVNLTEDEQKRLKELEKILNNEIDTNDYLMAIKRYS
ncbi:hypothetical protein OW763_03195 [Clostridium aestuarii]|uniref:Uncharacterized protein n=1 Tax=Clostridium aestuarii TaxID=338193 RepID=A0ABT4CWH8_9CLOT|nr:hypothetical protein [Clostridium aestuarii]MCY6483362.1 hypothetical protein [Clostridium aestuarii]